MDADEHPGMPRWVKLTIVAALALLVIALLAALVMGGEHGPGRHA